MVESSKRPFGEIVLSVLLNIEIFLVLFVLIILDIFRMIIRFLWIGIQLPYRWIVYTMNELDYLYPLAPEDLKKNNFVGRIVIWLEKIQPKMGSRIDSFLFGDGDRAKNNRVFLYFLVPSLLSFVMMVILPFITGIYYSFTDFSGIGNADWIGGANYERILTDVSYLYSFYRTVLYSVLNIIVINIVAFSLALLVTQKLKLKNLYRAGFFMPNLIGGLVLGFIFQFIYSNVLTQLGESNVVQWIGNLIGNSELLQNSLLTTGADNALIAIIIVVTWQYAGYIMMIYIAAIQNIPQSLVEASKIDGANAIQRLRNITFPLVAQAFTVAMFLTLVTSFKQFDTVFAMTGGGPTDIVPAWIPNLVGGNPLTPVPSLDLMAVNIWDTAFAYRQQGFGQAKAIIFFVILLIISLLQVYYNKKREVEL